MDEWLTVQLTLPAQSNVEVGFQSFCIPPNISNTLSVTLNQRMLYNENKGYLLQLKC